MCPGVRRTQEWGAGVENTCLNPLTPFPAPTTGKVFLMLSQDPHPSPSHPPGPSSERAPPRTLGPGCPCPSDHTFSPRLEPPCSPYPWPGHQVSDLSGISLNAPSGTRPGLYQVQIHRCSSGKRQRLSPRPLPQASSSLRCVSCHSTAMLLF